MQSKKKNWAELNFKQPQTILINKSRRLPHPYETTP